MACAGAAVITLALSVSADAQVASSSKTTDTTTNVNVYEESAIRALGTLTLCCDCTLQPSGVLHCDNCNLEGVNGCGNKDKITINTPSTGESDTFCDPDYAYYGRDDEATPATVCLPDSSM